MKKTLLLFVFVLVCHNPVFANSKIKVVWLANLPSESTSKAYEFWEKTKLFMEAASEDLDIELKIHYYFRNYVKMLQYAEEAVSSEENKPDVLLFHNYKKNGEAIIRICQNYGVKAFIFNSGFGEDTSIGVPRGKYKNWIGQMFPDDEKAGLLLTQALMKEAIKLNKVGQDGKIHIIALGGSQASQASIARIKALNRAVSQNEKFIIKQILHAEWSKKKAYNSFDFIIERYPHSSVFWAASDPMALGIHEKATEKGWKANIDYLTGGIDWFEQAINLVKEGKYTVSVGGHFAEGAWAMIVIHDYLKGQDFAQTESTTIKTDMFALTKDNIHLYKSIVKNTREFVRKVDFRRFSKIHNPGIKKYDFRIVKLLEFLE